MLKSHSCGELNKKHVGIGVTLAGWVDRRRDHGGLIFIDLRDREGVVQVVFNPETSPQCHKVASELRSEYVVRVSGEVAARPAGTENPKLATGEIGQEPARIGGLRDRLEDGILARIPDVQVNGHPTLRLPNILNVSFAFVEGESLLLALDTRGIAVSTGSACTAGSTDPSHVLLAMGLDRDMASGSLRFSFGRENDEEDVGYVLDNLVDVVQRLRELSPKYAGRDNPRGTC